LSHTTKSAGQSWPLRQYAQIKQCGKEIDKKLLVIIMMKIKGFTYAGYYVLLYLK